MVTTVDDDVFSYADPEDPPLKRFVIRCVEHLTGQPYLRWLYDEFNNHPIPGENFFDAAVRLLELNVKYDAAKLAAWPKTGPLVVICNHPFGVMDGLVSCCLVAKARPDFRVMTNAVLYREEKIRSFLLPIDFTETKEALKTNLKSRAEAKDHLLAGGCMLVFPSGAVSTTPTMWARRAVDPEWKTFAARMITQTRAAVAPIYFAGQNSRLFQVASHISLMLRLSLLFKETHDQIGAEIRAAVGEAVPYEALEAIRDRKALMQHLRDMTYALGAGMGDPPKPRLKRPRRAPRPGDPVPSFA
jgi:putative hemolysin